MSQSHEELAAELTCRWINGALKMAGITHQELTRRSGIGRTAICRMLNNRQSVHMVTLLRILEACGLEIEHLKVRKRAHPS